MSTQNKRLLTVAAAVTAAAALVGALTYAAYRSRTLSSAPSPATSGKKPNSAVPSSRADHQSAADSVQPPMTLPPESTIPPGERAKAFELLDALKQQANVAFQEGRYADAIQRYQDCIEVTDVLGAHDAEAVKVDQVVRANVIMTFIRMHDYDAARFVATMLLQDAGVALPEDLKVKVLYRRGLASKSLGNKEAALADFRAALHFSKDQQNAVVAKEIEMLEKAR